MKGSVLGLKKIQKCHVLTEAKLGDFDTQLEKNEDMF